MKLWCWSQSGR